MLSMIIYFSFITLLNKLPIDKKIDYILKIPILNSYYKIYRTYQFSNELSLFYKNGVSLQSIVFIYQNEQNNEFFKYLGSQLLEGADNGRTLPLILKI